MFFLLNCLNMEKLMLDGDVVQLCRNISALKRTNADIQKVKKVAVKVFSSTIIYSKNTYIAIFLEKKLKELENCSDKIFHKLCCEILVLLATVNNPTKHIPFSNQYDICTEDPRDKFLTALDFTTRVQCINTLYKQKEFEFMWRVALQNSPHNEYVNSLSYLSSISQKKIYFYCAFSTLYETYHFSNSVYNKLIFQCMLKISYLLDDENSLRAKIFVRCMEYIPRLETQISQHERIHTSLDDKHDLQSNDCINNTQYQQAKILMLKNDKQKG